MKKPIISALVLLAGLVTGGVQAANQGSLKYTEGPYDAASGVYTVVKGDNLAAIAERFGVTASELKSQNKFAADQIEVGQSW